MCNAKIAQRVNNDARPAANPTVDQIGDAGAIEFTCISDSNKGRLQLNGVDRLCQLLIMLNRPHSPQALPRRRVRSEQRAKKRDNQFSRHNH